MIDLLWSVLCYSGALTMIIGVVSVIKPIRLLRVRTRRRGGFVLIGGVLAVLAACLTTPVLTTAASSAILRDLAAGDQRARRTRHRAPPWLEWPGW